MSRLIVNADDFGLTPGVNRAILELHQAGILTSTTLMARAPATSDAVRIARHTPSLGVGCHVVLVDGKSMTAGLETLAPGGRFHATLGSFVARLLAGQFSQTVIETEAHAQISTLQSLGVHLSHIDTHKHTHMFPQVLRPVLRAARACGIRAVRNPFEPSWSLRATPTAPTIRRMEVHALRLLRSSFMRIVAEEGFSTTDGAVGVLATGTLDTATATSLLQSMPPGTWEMVTHPGYNDAELAEAHTRLLATRETERAALDAVKITPGFHLISFSELNAPASCE